MEQNVIHVYMGFKVANKIGYSCSVLLDNNSKLIKPWGIYNRLEDTKLNEVIAETVFENLKLIDSLYGLENTKVFFYMNKATYLEQCLDLDSIANWRENNYINSSGKPVAYRHVWEKVHEHVGRSILTKVISMNTYKGWVGVADYLADFCSVSDPNCKRKEDVDIFLELTTRVLNEDSLEGVKQLVLKRSENNV